MLPGMNEGTISTRISRRANEHLKNLSVSLGMVATTRGAVVDLMCRAFPTATMLLAAVARQTGGDPAAAAGAPSATTPDGHESDTGAMNRLRDAHAADVKRLRAEHAVELRRLAAEHKAALEVAVDEGVRRGRREDRESGRLERAVLERLIAERRDEVVAVLRKMNVELYEVDGEPWRLIQYGAG